MNINWRNDNYNNNDKYPYQTILDLYESNLSPDIIASQLDISKDDVINTLKSNQLAHQNKEKSIIEVSSNPKYEMENSISGFDVENSMQDIQKRIWSKLKAKSISNIHLKDTQKLLENVVNTDISCNFICRFSKFNKVINELASKKIGSNNTSIYTRNVFDS
jgi:hypothetical protein